MYFKFSIFLTVFIEFCLTSVLTESMKIDFNFIHFIPIEQIIGEFLIHVANNPGCIVCIKVRNKASKYAMLLRIIYCQ